MLLLGEVWIFVLDVVMCHGGVLEMSLRYATRVRVRCSQTDAITNGLKVWSVRGRSAWLSKADLSPLRIAARFDTIATLDDIGLERDRSRPAVQLEKETTCVT